MNYEEQAKGFLDTTGTTIKIRYSRNDKYFHKDEDKRDIYNVTLDRGTRSYTFTFGQSLQDSGFKYRYNIIRTLPMTESWRRSLMKMSFPKMMKHVKWDIKKICSGFGQVTKDEIILPKKPTAYDILACLSVYDNDDFDDFCDNFGYSNDSKSAEELWENVREQEMSLKMLFNDQEIDQLNQIV